MIIKESAENYLETIMMLQKKQGQVRSIDIVNEMGYSKPTISEQMKRFRENGYIEVDSDGYITLTDIGIRIAERMCERHEVIAQMLMSLGVDKETAYVDSCKIEHDISDSSFECMKAHFDKKRNIFR